MSSVRKNLILWSIGKIMVVSLVIGGPLSCKPRVKNTSLVRGGGGSDCGESLRIKAEELKLVLEKIAAGKELTVADRELLTEEFGKENFLRLTALSGQEAPLRALSRLFLAAAEANIPLAEALTREVNFDKTTMEYNVAEIEKFTASCQSSCKLLGVDVGDKAIEEKAIAEYATVAKGEPRLAAQLVETFRSEVARYESLAVNDPARKTVLEGIERQGRMLAAAVTAPVGGGSADGDRPSGSGERLVDILRTLSPEHQKAIVGMGFSQLEVTALSNPEQVVQRLNQLSAEFGIEAAQQHATEAIVRSAIAAVSAGSQNAGAYVELMNKAIATTGAAPGAVSRIVAEEALKRAERAIETAQDRSQVERAVQEMATAEGVLRTLSFGGENLATKLGLKAEGELAALSRQVTAEAVSASGVGGQASQRLVALTEGLMKMRTEIETFKEKRFEVERLAEKAKKAFEHK